MEKVKVFWMVTAAFIAGAFLASPELRAYAAATIGSADIIDGSIQSIDIGSGQVKTADIGGSAVTTPKIKDGTIQIRDTSFLKVKVLHDNAAGNAAGFIPGDQSYKIIDTDVTPESVLLGVQVSNGDITVRCDADEIFDGSFQGECIVLPDAATFHYMILKP
jgi:hypothetical protein